MGGGARERRLEYREGRFNVRDMYQFLTSKSHDPLLATLKLCIIVYTGITVILFFSRNPPTLVPPFMQHRKPQLG